MVKVIYARFVDACSIRLLKGKKESGYCGISSESVLGGRWSCYFSSRYGWVGSALTGEIGGQAEIIYMTVKLLQLRGMCVMTVSIFSLGNVSDAVDQSCMLTSFFNV